MSMKAKQIIQLGLGCIFSGMVQAQGLADLPHREVPMVPLAGEVSFPSEKLEASIKKGVDFLLSTQNKSGSWGGANRTKGLNIYAPIPGSQYAFRYATSALALQGLVLANDSRPEVKASIEKGAKWLLHEADRIRRPDTTTTYNNWAYLYGLEVFSTLAQRQGVTEEEKSEYQKVAQMLLDRALVNQGADGGWGYYNRYATARPSGGSTSFTTAGMLVAIHHAQQVFHLKVPATRIKMAIMQLRYQRTPDFCYVYSRDHHFGPRYPVNRPAGSLGRSQAGNAATRLWGDMSVTDAVLVQWLDRLVKRNGWLDIGRKRPVPHEAPFQIAGYFYYFGHYYAAECIQLLPAAQRPQWQQKLAKIIVSKQDGDGSWWDFPLYNYHQAYGTGFALSTLARCRIAHPNTSSAEH